MVRAREPAASPITAKGSLRRRSPRRHPQYQHGKAFWPCNMVVLEEPDPEWSSQHLPISFMSGFESRAAFSGIRNTNNTRSHSLRWRRGNDPAEPLRDSNITRWLCNRFLRFLLVLRHPPAVSPAILTACPVWRKERASPMAWEPVAQAETTP